MPLLGAIKIPQSSKEVLEFTSFVLQTECYEKQNKTEKTRGEMTSILSGMLQSAHLGFLSCLSSFISSPEEEHR